MRKVLLVLGCLLFSGNASAEIDCKQVKTYIENSWEAFNLFIDEAEKYQDNKPLSDENYGYADLSLSNASKYANIYNALCKN